MVKLRKINGFTQETFAAAVGVSRQSVYKWESGASYPEVEKLFKISRLFHVTVDDMLNEEMDVSVNGTMMTVAEVQAEADRLAAEKNRQEAENLRASTLPSKHALTKFAIHLAILLLFYHLY
jgi:DNA-binding XRE family transcriptional regulator